jgi:hypothetical protein
VLGRLRPWLPSLLALRLATGHDAVAVLSQDDEASAIAALSQVSERTRQRVDEEVMRDWPSVEGAGS